MASRTGVTEDEYKLCEAGRSDLNFAFLYRCALGFGVDVTDLIEGRSPTLRSYTLTRAGEGQKIEQAHGMVYYNMAADFQNRISEPLYVINKYSETAEHSDIELTSHEGQECDLVVEGTLKVQVGSHTETLHKGDCIYYDSGTPHGMIAVDGKDCIFYAIVLNPQGETVRAKDEIRATAPARTADRKERIYKKYVETEKDENGLITKIAFKNEKTFNFAFDIVDELGRTKPDKLCMLHVSEDMTERRFTFLGHEEGIRPRRQLLQIPRHQAGRPRDAGAQAPLPVLVRDPGPAQAGRRRDPRHKPAARARFLYRFQTAGVSAILCTADGETADAVDRAALESPTLKTKILVGGQREGWHDFNAEYTMFSSSFRRQPDSPCGEDPMLMFFTSGTSGYPKIAAHNYLYPLGHFITAKYWHCVNPDGLHLTISDTGWAKSLWGKLYGQWLCEGAVFVYDFDRFDAEKILPMFAKIPDHHVLRASHHVPHAHQGGPEPLRPLLHPARDHRGRGAEPRGLPPVREGHRPADHGGLRPVRDPR
jgi:acetyl-CoA synthetase